MDCILRHLQMLLDFLGRYWVITNDERSSTNFKCEKSWPYIVYTPVEIGPSFLFGYFYVRDCIWFQNRCTFWCWKGMCVCCLFSIRAYYYTFIIRLCDIKMWFYLTSWLLLSVKNLAEISKKTVDGYNNSTRETILFRVKYIVNIIQIAWHAASLASPLFIRIRWPSETDERNSVVTR